jgi:geranylgeranylglycerol-phosphate geranylgeranyltransferase
LTEKLTTTIKLIRPVNYVITFVSVIVAAIICQPHKTLGLNIFLAAFAASFALASGNIINDINDVEADKINKPFRPLASEKITIRQAYVLYISSVFLSILISAFLDEVALAIVLFSILLLFVYSKFFKKIPLIGNIIVAFLTGLVFIFGGVVVENPIAAIVPAIFAFLINLIREIVKDMEDVEGDSKADLVTFPIKFGIQKSKILILIIAVILILFTLYPFFTQLYKIQYFIAMMVIVNPIIAYSVKILFENSSQKYLKKISNLLKLSMVFGLIAIYLGV